MANEANEVSSSSRVCEAEKTNVVFVSVQSNYSWGQIQAQGEFIEGKANIFSSPPFMQKILCCGENSKDVDSSFSTFCFTGVCPISYCEAREKRSLGAVFSTRVWIRGLIKGGGRDARREGRGDKIPACPTTSSAG